MATIVNHKDPRSGTVYVYSSESYWDKEKKQPRSRRKLIGKLDEKTGQVVPTGKSGRRKTTKGDDTDTSSPEKQTVSLDVLAEKDDLIRTLKDEIRDLKRERKEMITALEDLSRRWSV